MLKHRHSGSSQERIFLFAFSGLGLRFTNSSFYLLGFVSFQFLDWLVPNECTAFWFSLSFEGPKPCLLFPLYLEVQVFRFLRLPKVSKTVVVFVFLGHSGFALTYCHFPPVISFTFFKMHVCCVCHRMTHLLAIRLAKNRQWLSWVNCKLKQRDRTFCSSLE